MQIVDNVDTKIAGRKSGPQEVDLRLLCFKNPELRTNSNVILLSKSSLDLLRYNVEILAYEKVELRQSSTAVPMANWSLKQNEFQNVRSWAMNRYTFDSYFICQWGDQSRLTLRELSTSKTQFKSPWLTFMISWQVTKGRCTVLYEYPNCLFWSSSEFRLS